MRNKVCTSPRYSTLGGTDCSAILGLNPYKSPFDTWLEKTQKKAELPEINNKYIYWGKLLEDVIAGHYAAKHGVELIRSPQRVLTDKPWFSGSPDRLILAKRPEDGILDGICRKNIIRRGLEIKTGLAKHIPEWGPSYQRIRDFDHAKGNVPLYYWAQCQWYMHLMDFPEWHCVVKLDSSEYLEFFLDRDDSWLKEAVDTCEVFWTRYVEPEIRPPLDWGKTCSHYLDNLYGEHSDELRKADAIETILGNSWRQLTFNLGQTEERIIHLARDLERLEKSLRSTKKEEAALKRQEAEIKNLLRERIGRAAGIQLPGGGVVTWKRPAGENKSRIMRKRWA